VRGLTWIPDERIAVGAMPVGDDAEGLPAQGVTHAVNCRAGIQTIVSQDLWAERAILGADNVAHAPMWDNGKPQSPAAWSAAALWAARVLDDDPTAGVLIHCQQGRRRSVLVAYAVLRLRGRTPADAARAILTARPVTQLVPTYRASVERWLESVATPTDGKS
jgi:hypothetical protein